MCGPAALLFTSFVLQVFGISGDAPAENKAFKEAQNLPYDLLTDENNILRKEFGIPNAMMVLPGVPPALTHSMSFLCLST